MHSAVYDPKNHSIVDTDTNYGKQFIFVIVAVVLGIFILLLESRVLSALAPAIYTITTLLLILVLVIGRNVGGNRGTDLFTGRL
ncbi:FtsW/RodA/SpoVE family cell cycle protein [Mucilaginibacter humi]|uniref:FtsW/RodA/SpoVE family cell cycle protein n=1 Tax=Mucilaginibacter humi TaxID=2732510 RepID=UPI00293BDAE4|nr:FtsW/RodA/SpoVE family cell cycle protein [Mucilaginibacter humi]